MAITPTPTEQPTFKNELNCNYGVNYTRSSDFYGTYILDTCYTLNIKSTDPPFTVSLQYSCDFITGEINEKVWWNQICIDTVNHTNPGHLQIKHCTLNKIAKQCNFVWLSSFRQHSRECKPHEHTIFKFGMILDECILYDSDQSAFKNIYTQTENNRRQIIQFQYLSIDDCLNDDMNSDNIDVTQSIADDIYDFIHEECNSGRYYIVQPPFPQTITTETKIMPNKSNLTTVSLQITNITNTTPQAIEFMCNYMIHHDTSMDFYSTILLNKCYSQVTGSKKYECQNDKFMLKEWILDRFCDGPQDKPNNIQNKTYCSQGNDRLCDTISVLQYYADDNCTQESVTDESFIEEYTFIIGICLEYVRDDIYIYNRGWDEHNPNEITQFHFDSYDECINAIFDTQAIEQNSITIIHEQCIGEFYYEILISKKATPTPFVPFANLFVPVYITPKNKSIGGETITIGLVIFVLLASIILIVCCGVICWYGRLTGCWSKCWNVLCCGRYSRISDGLIKDDDTDNDSIEMGDNMEFAALSERRDDSNREM